MRCCLLAFFCFAANLRAASPAEEITGAQLVESVAIARYQASSHTAADRAELEKITRIYDQLVKKYPRNATVRENYGVFLWQIERRDAAFTQWKIGEELDPKNPGIVFHLGHSYLDRGDAKKATQYFARASELAPHEALFHFNLGNALLLFRHEMTDPGAPDDETVMRRALDQFRLASEIEPLNADFAKAYADAFYLLQPPDWNAAIKAWQRYLNLGAGKDLAYTNLARVSLKMGRNTEARAYLDQIASPGFARIKDRLTRQLNGEQEASFKSQVIAH